MRNILCATESCQIEDCAVKFSREIRVFPATRPAIINRRFSPHHTIGSLSVEQWGAEDLKDTRLTKSNEATARNEKGVRGKEMFLLGTPHNGKKKRGRSISGGEMNCEHLRMLPVGPRPRNLSIQVLVLKRIC